MSNGKMQKGEVAAMMIFFVFIMLLFIVLEYMVETKFWLPNTDNIVSKAYLHFIYRGKYMLMSPRWLYPVFFLLALKLGISRRVDNPKDYRGYWIMILICYLPYAFGYLDNKPLYNIIAMPILWMMLTYSCFMFGNSFVTEWYKGVHPLSNTSHVDANKDIRIEFNVTNQINNTPNKLFIHSPMQGVYVQGGAGTGKTASLFEPIHYQTVCKGFAGVIYDFKGSERPLTKGIYNTLLNRKEEILKTGYKVPTFHFFSLQEPFRTTCCINPLNPKYIRSDADAKMAATALFRNLDKSTIKKQDFWSNNSLLYTRSCIWMLCKNYPQYATIPHLISLILHDAEDVVRFLDEDEEIGPRMQSIIAAADAGAGSQLAGIKASVQIPFADIFNEDIFWFLAPDEHLEEIDLNLNDARNPILLCLANYESKRDMNNPILGCIMNLIINVIRDQPKTFKNSPFLLSVDESPTIYLDKIETVPAEMRSKRVMTLLGAQTESQYINEMNKEIATVILDNLSNIFMGGTNNKDHATKLSDMMGQYDKEKISFSNSESGESQSMSQQKEKCLSPEKIVGQKIGQFSGKIADGEPPFFHVQMEDGRTHIKLGIEESEMKDVPVHKWFVEDNIQDIDKKMDFQMSIYKELRKEKFKRIFGEIKDLLEESKARREALNPIEEE